MLLSLSSASAIATAREAHEAQLARARVDAGLVPPGPDASPEERLRWVLAGDGEG